jgi:U3 small nucleolar ribonucleoprotein protein IMP4
LLLITTSHRSSPRVRSFIKDLVSVLPGAIRIQRGHKTLRDIALEAYRNGLKYALIVKELYGNPRVISLYKVLAEPSVELVKIADLVLKGVVLSRENPVSSRVYGVDSLEIDYSNCLSSDCYLLADVLSMIFQPKIRENADLKVVLEEEKYIHVKFKNIHGKTVGPVLRVIRVIRGGKSEA